jgi:hypothetical protein
MEAVVSTGTLQPVTKSKKLAQHCITHAQRGVAITHRVQHFIPIHETEGLKVKATCSPETSLTFNGLHGVMSQKTHLFIITAVKASNPTSQ